MPRRVRLCSRYEEGRQSPSFFRFSYRAQFLVAEMGTETMHSVFIGNLSDHARHEDIEKFFKGYGSLRDISLKGGYGKLSLRDDK